MCDVPRRVRGGAEAGNAVVGGLVGLVLLVACTQILGAADRHMKDELARLPPASELVYAPPAKFLKIISLGYDNALADALWFRAINYFGTHYRSDRAYPWLGQMCDRVTDLDPSATYVYRFAGLILPWEANLVDEGIALLQKGTRNLPNSWELHYMLGFTFYFFKDDLSASARELRAALVIPGAPTYVSELLAVVDAADRGPDSAIAFLQAIVQRGETPEVNDAVRQRIRDLVITRDIDELQAAVTRFEIQFQRPPVDLFELVVYGLVPFVPPDPFHGKYVLNQVTGQVFSSSGRQPKRLGSSKMRESVIREERARTGR